MVQHYNLDRIRQIMDLLQRSGTLTQVSNLLKAKGAKSSAGSWDAMLDLRIIPALESRRIAESDIQDLLRDAEEHGRAHVFHYKCAKAEAKRIFSQYTAALRDAKQSRLLTHPKMLDTPDKPTLADVREHEGQLIVKEVEKRESRVFTGQQVNGSKLIMRYDLNQRRAVNVARLFPTGMLEVCVGATSNVSDGKYRGLADGFLKRISHLVPGGGFEDFPLTKARQQIIENREELGDIIRYSGAAARNSHGVTLELSTGGKKDTLVGRNGEDVLDRFGEDDSVWVKANIWFKTRKNQAPTKDIHVKLYDNNEFAIAAGDPQDHAYVRRQILRFCK